MTRGMTAPVDATSALVAGTGDLPALRDVPAEHPGLVLVVTEMWGWRGVQGPRNYPCGIIQCF